MWIKQALFWSLLSVLSLCFGISHTRAQEIYYTYKDGGSWHAQTTWTKDATGLTLNPAGGAGVPPASSQVVIKHTSSPVFLDANVTEENLDLTIESGASLDLRDKSFDDGLFALRGKGRLLIASNVFPQISAYMTFLEGNGGTLVFNFPNQAPVNIESFPTTVWNLEFAAKGKYAYQLKTGQELKVLNNLSITDDAQLLLGGIPSRPEVGTFFSRKKLTVEGYFTVGVGASLSVIDGMLEQATPTNEPLSYYESSTHIVELHGDWRNSGSVTLHTLPSLDFARTAVTTQNVTVIARGQANATFQCNGQTDLYALVVDKGTSVTTELTVEASTRQHFRLWGGNSQEGRQALLLMNGTLKLAGKTAIASLAEKGTYVIQNTCALVLDGADVLVVQKAQNAKQVADVWGLTEGQVHGVGNPTTPNDGAALEIAGVLYVKAGSYAVGDGSVITTGNMSSGELRIGDGQLFAPQIYSGVMSLTFQQEGGLVVLRGRRADKDVESYASTINPARSYGATYTATPNYGKDRGALDLKQGDAYIHSQGELRVVGASENGDMNYIVVLAVDDTNLSHTRGGKEVIDLSGLTLTPTTTPEAPEGFVTIASKARLGNFEVLLNTDRQILYTQFNTAIDGSLHHKKGVLSLSYKGDARTLSIGKNFQLEATLDALKGALVFPLPVEGASFVIAPAARIVENHFRSLSISSSDGKDDPKRLFHFNAPIDYSFTELRAAGTARFHIVNRPNRLIVKNILNIGGYADVYGGQVVLDGSSITAGSWGYLEDCLLTENTNVKLLTTLRINKLLTLSQNSELNIGAYRFDLSAGAKIETPGDGTGHIKTNGKYTDGGVRKSFNASDKAEFVIPFGYRKGTQLVDRRMTIRGRERGIFYFSYVEDLHPMLRKGYPFYLRVKREGAEVTDNATVTMKNTEATLPSNYRALFLKKDNSGKDKEWVELPTLPTATELCFNLQKNGFDYVVGERYNITTYVSVRDGNWNDVMTWSPQGVPLVGDIVNVKHKVHIAPIAPQYPNYAIGCGALTIDPVGTLDVPDMSQTSINQISGNGKLRLRLHPDAPQQDKFLRMPEISAFIAREKINGVEDFGTIEFYMEQANKEVRLPEQLNSFGHFTCSYEQAGQTFVVSQATGRLDIHGNFLLNNPDAHANAIFSLGGVLSTYPQERSLSISKRTDIHNVFLYISNPEKTHSFRFLGEVHFRGSSRIVYTGSNPTWSCVADVYFYGDLYNETDGELNFAGNNLYSRVLYVNSMPARIAGVNPVLFREFRLRMNRATAELSIDNIGGIRSAASSSLEWFFIDNPGTIHINSAFDFHITSKQNVTIRSGFTFHVNNDNVTVRIATDCERKMGLHLYGKLKIEKGKVFIGRSDLPANKSADLECAAYANPTIEIQSGELNIYGALRRDPKGNAGLLNYIQTGGTVTVSPTAKNAGKRGLEIYGDRFEVSGGELIFGGSGGTVSGGGDVFILSSNSSVTGGSMHLTGNGRVYLASMPSFYNFSCEGNNQEVHVYRYPLDIKGTTTVAATSKLFVDDVDIAFAGNMRCDGVFQSQNNTTRFYAQAQRIYGNATKFSAHHFSVECVNGLSYELPVDVSLSGNLAIEKKSASAEHLNLKNRTWTLAGNLFNDGGYKTGGGLLQLVGSERSELAGNGNYGSIEVKKTVGALAKNDVHLYGNLLLSEGNFHLDRYLLHIAKGGKIDQLTTSHYIVTEGSFVSKGIRQDLEAGVKKVSFPIGTADAYTPAEFTMPDLGYPNNNGSIRVLNVASSFDAVGDCREKVLLYHWEVESQQLATIGGEFKFSCPTSFKGANMVLEESAPLRFVAGSWTQQTKRQLSEQGSTFTQLWKFNAVSSLSGRYTSGAPLCLLNIREVETFASGNWESDIWKLYGKPTNVYLPDGPNGLTIHVNPEHTVTIQGKANAEKIVFENPAAMQAEGVLVVENTATISSLGSLHGKGALQVYKGTLPVADYTDFFGCTHDGKLVLAGNNNYALEARANNEYPYLHLIGSGKRVMPNADLTVCKELKIRDNTVYDNSAHNKGLSLLGTIDRESTAAFLAGTGNDAWVSFKGTAPQAFGGTGGGFDGANKLNKLIIDNEHGVTVRTGGNVEISDLSLLKGVLHTPRNASGRLLQTPAQTNTTTPNPTVLGSIQSYVDGPLWVKIPTGVTSYCFPLGVGTSLANQMLLSDLTPGMLCVEVVVNTTALNVQSPLTLVDRRVWKVSGNAAASAKVSFLREGFDWATGKNNDELSVAKKGALKWEEIASEAHAGGLGNEIRTVAAEALVVAPLFTEYSFGAKSAVPPTLSYENLGGRYCVPVSGVVTVPVKIVASGEWGDYLPMLIKYKVGNNVRTFEVSTTSSSDDVFDLPIRSTDDPVSLPLLSESITFQVLSLTYRHNTTPGTGQVDPTILTAYRIPDVAPGSYDMCFNKGSAVNLQGQSKPLGTPTWVNDDAVGTFTTSNAYATRFTLSATVGGLVLKLKVDNHGCVGEKNADLNQAQPTTGSITGSQRVCLLDGNPAEEVYTFTPLVQIPPLAYTWSLEDKPNSLTDLKIVDGTQVTNPAKVNWVATPPYHGAQKYQATVHLNVVDKNQCLSTFELPVEVVLEYRTAPVYFTPYND